MYGKNFCKLPFRNNCLNNLKTLPNYNTKYISAIYFNVCIK
jgi:hypothetical protein